ncbi:Pyruvate dehydrogenase E1 component subunit alpha [Nymphon striatum]|nr:Pyruvate dehydrogenase E1 component subunit alpha [Nymphon striatum]
MITAYRNHVQPIGMGVDPKRVMAELYGKVTGTSQGMGGSMHIFSKEHRFHGGHGIMAMNPVVVAEEMSKAIERARSGGGPTFLEMKTYRYRGHSMSDAQHYRTKAEVEEYKKIDPITQVLDIIKEKEYATDEEIDAIGKSIKSRVAECEKFAEDSAYPPVQQLYDMVYEQEDFPFVEHK